MKYIDADKLIAEIERLGRNWDGIQELQPASLFQADLYELLSIITSLQQEQPIGEEYTIEVGKHTHTLRVGSQSDIDKLIRQEKQEQPEVDLEEEIKDMYSRDTGTLKTRAQYAKLARHFYELGLNARAVGYELYLVYACRTPRKNERN